MLDKKLSADYQALLNRFYPGTLVLPGLNTPEAEDIPVLDVFGIPDEKLGDFMRFKLNQLPDEERNLGLPECLLIHHSLSATREHYPGIWAELNARQARSTAVA